MHKLKKPVSIVMVAYNEEGHIERVIKEYYKDILLKIPKKIVRIFSKDEFERILAATRSPILKARILFRFR